MTEYGVTTVDLLIDDLGIFLQTLHVQLFVFNAHLLVKTSDKIYVSRQQQLRQKRFLIFGRKYLFLMRIY